MKRRARTAGRPCDTADQPCAVESSPRCSRTAPYRTDVRVHALRVPPLDNGVYVVADSRGDALVIDPSFGEREVLEYVRTNGLRVVEVLNTHGHADHTFGDAGVKAASGARVAIHRLDAYRLARNTAEIRKYFPIDHPDVAADRLLEEGDEVALADARLLVLHTPGHTEGSVCFQLPDAKLLFSGDTLFNAGLGRVDLPGGNAEQIVASLRRLMELPEETVVYPGHGAWTTIGAEKDWVLGLTAEALLSG